MLAAARAGSADALGQLWTDCRNYLLLVANEKLDPGLKAKVSPSDLVQETFLEAQRDLGQFRGEHAEELRAWLCRILINNLANVTRHYRDTEMRQLDRERSLGEEVKHAALEHADDTPSPCDKAIAQEELAALEQALARLPPHYRQVIRLRYDGHMTFAAIGEVIGCSSEAARKLWGRAVGLLEKELNPHEK